MPGMPNTQFLLHFEQTGTNRIRMRPSTSPQTTIRQWVELYRTCWRVFLGTPSFLPATLIIFFNRLSNSKLGSISFHKKFPKRRMVSSLSFPTSTGTCSWIEYRSVQLNEEGRFCGRAYNSSVSCVHELQSYKRILVGPFFVLESPGTNQKHPIEYPRLRSRSFR